MLCLKIHMVNTASIILTLMNFLLQLSFNSLMTVHTGVF